MTFQRSIHIFFYVLIPIVSSVIQPTFLIISSKYYEKDSLVADPDYGTILSSLLGEFIDYTVKDSDKTRLEVFFNLHILS